MEHTYKGRIGYIPLWRKTLDNDIFRHDPTAWRVFETLLLLADRRTRSWEGGRKQLADYACVKESATYKALKRLEKAEMVTLSSNNKYSVISICNWDSHQPPGNSSGNNKVTTKEQQSNTLTRSKKVKSKKVNTKVLTIDKRNPEIKLVIEHFEKQIGKMPRPTYQPMAASELIKDHTFNTVIGAINAVAATRGQPFAPNIASLEELRDKWIKLENFLGRVKATNKPRRNI